MKKLKFLEFENNPFFKVLFWKGEKNQKPTICFLGKRVFIMILKGEILLKSNERMDFLSEGFHITLPTDSTFTIEVLDSCEMLFTFDSNSNLSLAKQ